MAVEPTLLLDDLISQAEDAYMAESGGAAVCQLHKDGRVTGGLKYQEGRLVALRAVRRRLQRADDASPTALAHAIRREQESWQADLAHHSEQPDPALPWMAYAQGGVDALERLAARLTAPES